MDQEMYEQYAMQSELQRQASEGGQFVNAPMMHEQMQQSQAILVEQTNPSRVLREIELSLRNIEELEDGKFISRGEPIMNQFGINRIRFILRGIINQNTILSHLDDRMIGRLMMQFSDDLTDDLTLNWRAYGIKDKALLDHIENSILIPVLCALNRALEQNEKNWLGKISVENISNSGRTPIKKSGGFLDKFKL